MLATSRDSESWRRPAAVTSSWEWFSTMAEGRSPSATVLWLRQYLAFGRNSSFAVFGAQWIKVLRYVIPHQEVMTRIDVGDDNSTPDMLRTDRILSLADFAAADT